MLQSNIINIKCAIAIQFLHHMQNIETKKLKRLCQKTIQISFIYKNNQDEQINEYLAKKMKGLKQHVYQKTEVMSKFQPISYNHSCIIIFSIIKI